MALIKYTQADFDALKRGEDGYIHVPEGSWSGVDFGSADKLRIAAGSFLGSYCELGNWCELGNGCELGNWCRLGDGCVLGACCVLGDGCVLGACCVLGNGFMLGNGCKLGNGCMLGKGCRLGNGCMLGNECRLGNWCKLGKGCMLGNGCRLGNKCRLGNWCKLGTKCELGDGCSMEGGRVPNATYYIVTNIGSRNDDAYAYCDTATGDIYVRAGCWFGGIDEFIARVHDVHAGTQHETDYIALAEFARARFRRYHK